MLDLVVDTNELYNPSGLRRVASLDGIRLWGSVANLIETISDAEDEATLRAVKGRLRLINEVCQNEILPDGDALCLRAIGLPWTSGDKELLEEIVPRVLAAPDYPRCLPDISRVKEARSRHATLFRAGINEIILNGNPAADVNESAWRVRVAPELLGEIVKELSGIAFQYAIAFMFHLRLGDRLHGRVPDLVRVTDLYARAYRGWLLRTFEDGRKPEPNDAIDLHFFIPVHMEGWALLTEEGQLRKIAGRGGIPLGKLRRIAEIGN